MRRRASVGIFILFLLVGCFPPGELRRLPSSANLKSTDFSIDFPSGKGRTISVQYTGCGGLYMVQNGTGIMIDPFFSHQSMTSLGRSVLSRDSRKRLIRSDSAMVALGISAIESKTGPIANQVAVVFTAHSHYDHLMDVPAVFSYLRNTPPVYVNQSGYNICSNVIHPGYLKILEQTMTTQETSRPPVEIPTQDGRKILVYPILAAHNPHWKNIKIFDGATSRPIDYFKHPYDKTRANDWLEGNTFSFLIDYYDATGGIEFRTFIQSSSCNPPLGVPPSSLLDKRPVDVAFLGTASFEASPDYPAFLLEKLAPKKIVWIHWEDFFRSYYKNPKTVRLTKMKDLFEKRLAANYQKMSYTPWPRVRIEIKY